MRRAALLAALCAAPAFGQQAGEVRRGSVEQVVKVTGTVQAVDLFRLKSTIEGRAEQVWTTTGAWVSPQQDLGILVNKELAALTDVKSSTDKSVVEDRWQKVYQPTRIRCPYDCYILKAYARSKTIVKPRAVLFEAAAHLRLIGKVRPEDAHLIRDGMALDFWPVKNPSQRFHTKIVHYLLDVQGQKVQPGGTFMMDLVLGPKGFLPPDTEWEGLVVPAKKNGVLVVPTAALITFGGDVYLPIKVSTGLTSPEFTEMTAGVEAGRRILTLGETLLGEAQRHRMEADASALRQRIEEQSRPAPEADAELETPDAQPRARPQPQARPQPTVQPAAQPQRSRRGPEEPREPDTDLGEDPYSE